MAISSSLRKKLLAAAGGGAIAIAATMIPTLEGVEYKPYQDVAGVWTVCYGHTGKDIILGKRYTELECRALLDKDLHTTATQIDPYIKKPISENTRAALYSFAFNVGAGNFRTSTLLKRINLGDTAGACNQLKRWTYVNGKLWKGLIKRREIERDVCTWSQK